MKYKKITPSEPQSDRSEELKKERIKRGLQTGAVFVVLFGLFQALVKLEWKPVYPIYLTALTVLLLLFLFFNNFILSRSILEFIPIIIIGIFAPAIYIEWYIQKCCRFILVSHTKI